MMMEKTKVPEFQTLPLRDLAKYAKLIRLPRYGSMNRADLLEALEERRDAVVAALRAAAPRRAPAAPAAAQEDLLQGLGGDKHSDLAKNVMYKNQIQNDLPIMEARMRRLTREMEHLIEMRRAQPANDAVHARYLQLYAEHYELTEKIKKARSELARVSRRVSGSLRHGGVRERADSTESTSGAMEDTEEERAEAARVAAIDAHRTRAEDPITKALRDRKEP
jgi:hypothetical protein